MKKFVISTIGLLTLSAIIYSCSKSEDGEANAIDTDEFYLDDSGKFLIVLKDEGYNIYEEGKPYETTSATNKSAKTSSLPVLYPYSRVCTFPPKWPKGAPISSCPVLPNKQTTPSKKTITSNFKTLGGGYRVTPKPAFLGGSKYSCYECLVSGIERDDFYLGVCNGSIFISGAISDDPSFQSIKNSFSQINFNPSETEQFIQSITSSGLYNCTKR